LSGARAAGVCWDGQNKAWQAAIVVAGEGGSQLRHLGWFVNEVDAALAYDQAAREYHGDQAHLNFPDLPPQPQTASSKTPRQATSQYRGKSWCTEALGCSLCAGRLVYPSQGLNWWSRAAGVCWDRHRKRWRGEIGVTAGDGKSTKRTLGWFLNEVEAALAYDQAAGEHHKDKAQINFPDLPPQRQVASSKTPRQPATSQYRGKSRGT
jgi:hypothetical protein